MFGRNKYEDTSTMTKRIIKKAISAVILLNVGKVLNDWSKK